MVKRRYALANRNVRFLQIAVYTGNQQAGVVWGEKVLLRILHLVTQRKNKDLEVTLAGIYERVWKTNSLLK